MTPILGTMASQISGHLFVNTPPITSGLTHWYDGSDDTTMTKSSNQISQWNSKSPATSGVNVSNATGAQQPEYTANYQNGLSVVNFVDANSDHLGVGTQPTTGSTAFTVFMVLKPTTTAGKLVATSWGSEQAAGAGFDLSMGILLGANDGKYYSTFAGWRAVASSSTYSSAWSIVQAKYAGGTGSLNQKINNADSVSSTADGPISITNAPSGAKFNLGWMDYWEAQAGYDGYMGDVLIYAGTALSDADCTSTYDWLKVKWGL